MAKSGSGPSNVQVLLSRMIEERRAELSPGQDEGSFFEFLVATELLKSFDLSVDEVRDGLIGGGMDGGIDGLYVLVGGDPISGSHMSATFTRDVSVDVVLFQSKTTQSFSGLALDKLVSTISTLFDLGRDSAQLRRLYSDKLMERANLFRDFYSQHFSKISRMSIRAYYVTQGDQPHSAFVPQVETICGLCRNLFPGAQVAFSFVGAPELLQMLRTPPTQWLELKLAENALTAGGSGYVGLVRLKDFAAFLTDEEGNRRRRLFLENVRDFEGMNRVNLAIAATLEDPSSDDFWMLNNGVTILAEEVRQSYRALAMREPKIVNGLQTSTVLFDHFRARGDSGDERALLVRIVVPRDEAARDKIIVATNSQTSITSGVLRATDQIHKDLEDLFRTTELVYERRRNAYRNEGVQLEKIVTMPQLARSVASILLQEPFIAAKVNARSRLLDNPKQYVRVFSAEYPLAAYLASAQILKRVESLMGRPDLDPDPDEYMGRGRRPRLWFTQWHVAMVVAVRACAEGQVSPRSLGLLEVASIPDSLFVGVAGQVNEFFGLARRQEHRTVYQLTKAPTLTERLLSEIGAPKQRWRKPGLPVGGGPAMRHQT